MTHEYFEVLVAQVQLPGVFVSKEVIYAVLLFIFVRQILKSGAFKEFITPWGKFIFTRVSEPPPDPDPDKSDMEDDSPNSSGQ